MTTDMSVSFFSWGIADDFEKGQSRGNPGTTFGNPCLASGTDFEVVLMLMNIAFTKCICRILLKCGKCFHRLIHTK